MVKFLKPGKVVVVTRGKYAGRKGVIVKNQDVGTKTRPYGHAVVAGISMGPKRLKAGMSKKTIVARSKIHPFLKVLNYEHFMPTRYSFELDTKKLVAKNVLSDRAQKKKAIKRVRRQFKKAYFSGEKKWFFSRLHF
jgi:large subunit ribosomal protein L27e